MKNTWTVGIAGLLVAGVAFGAAARPEAPVKRSNSMLARVPSVRDIANRQTNLSALAGPKGLVVAFTSTSCPVTKRQLSNIAQLEDQFRATGINFV
jgi:hypothetical protein